MIAANNHYAGFGPGTVNIFRNMVGQSELSWQDQEHIQSQIQQATILYLVIPIVLISQRCISYLLRVRMNYMISIISHASTLDILPQC
jgi:hypothetical protein